MGYDVAGSGEITIKAELIEDAYKAVIALNEVPSNVKRGGTYQEGKKVSSHFSWMPADLNEFTSLKEIFGALGFDCEETPEDGLTITNYPWSKTGQEDFFFAAIAPYVTEGGYFFWDGEDNEYWKWTFTDKTMFVHEGVRKYLDGRPVAVKDLIVEWAAMSQRIADMFEHTAKTEG